jgi:hypothetical protein
LDNITNKRGLALFWRLESIDRLLSPMTCDGAIDSLILHTSTVEVIPDVKHYRCEKHKNSMTFLLQPVAAWRTTFLMP